MATSSERLRRPYRHARTDVVMALAAASSLLFIWLIAVPVFGPAKWARHAGHHALLTGHIVGGTVMLLAGAVALRIGLTKNWFRWHKPAGYAYIAGGTIAASVALIRSFDTKHTPGLATGTLAAFWLLFTAMAYRAVRNRIFDEHRDWMIRSYVLAWTFVFCRFWTRAAPASLQGDGSDMIWVTWIAPIMLAEMALQWNRGARRLPKSGRPAR